MHAFEFGSLWISWRFEIELCVSIEWRKSIAMTRIRFRSSLNFCENWFLQFLFSGFYAKRMHLSKVLGTYAIWNRVTHFKLVIWQIYAHNVHSNKSKAQLKLSFSYSLYSADQPYFRSTVSFFNQIYSDLILQMLFFEVLPRRRERKWEDKNYLWLFHYWGMQRFSTFGSLKDLIVEGLRLELSFGMGP